MRGGSYTVKKIFQNYHLPLFISVLLLSIFGLVMIYSASAIVAVAKLNLESDFFFNKQLRALIIGFCSMIFFSLFPYKNYRKGFFILAILGLMFGSLILVIIFGTEVNGARSWIDLGVMSIQPAEFAKLGVIIYLSVVFANRQKKIHKVIESFMGPGMITFLVFLFIARQPDFGTGMIICAIAIVLTFCSGTKLIKMFVILATLIVGGGSILFNFLPEEQNSRLDMSTSPFENFQDDGYQLGNSLISIGNGGLEGLGFGQSIQKYGYLPEAHTDFIMAIISEELGVFGVGFVLILLLTIITIGFHIAQKCKDPFGSLIAIGISSMIAIQALVNLGGLTNLIPLTGVPLPFVSYGGSSVLMLMSAMGILLNIYATMKISVKKQQTKGRYGDSA